MIVTTLTKPMLSNFGASALATGAKRICVILLAVAGCGDKVPYPHATVTGMVTVDGQPVPQGYVTFSPMSGGQGPVTGGKIWQGSYRCEQVAAGQSKVTFVAEAEEMHTFIDALGAQRQIPLSILPPRYLMGIDITVETGEVAMDFDLRNEP